MTTRRCHEMPFGAQLLRSGEARFRLWAPGARQVELILGEDTEATAVVMRSLAQGWFELTCEAGPGTRYRYRVDSTALVPDPASRRNPGDVHGPSEIINPRDFLWDDTEWRPRPWHQAVVYELTGLSI